MNALPAPAAAVLNFWFGAPDEPGHDQPRAEWFRKDDAFDTRIAQQFGGLIEQALAGDLTSWSSTPLAALAQIIVLDQFTRNCFRNTARAFAGDARALAAAQALVGNGADLQLSGVQRQFAYLPFEHAEDLALQDESIRLFTRLEADHPARAGLLKWAQDHRSIVARFGRFPHRNATLGRASTVDELAFLQTPGSSF